MRMVIISFVFLLIMIFIWVWFHFTSIELVTSYYSENLTDLSNIINIDNWDKADVDMVKYYNKWQETRNLWIYFLNQKDIDNIDASIIKLLVYIRNSNKTMAQAELEQLKVLFNVIKENECLSLENIF